MSKRVSVGPGEGKVEDHHCSSRLFQRKTALAGTSSRSQFLIKTRIALVREAEYAGLTHFKSSSARKAYAFVSSSSAFFWAAAAPSLAPLVCSLGGSGWAPVRSAFTRGCGWTARAGNVATPTPVAATTTANSSAVAILSLVRNMAFSTPSVKAATLAEITPVAAACPAATLSAALTVELKRSGGTPAPAAF